jgi:CRP-like cAMP-binding protein
MPNDAPHTADPRTNLILKSLSEKELGRLLPELERVDLTHARMIYYPEQAIDYVYFPGNAMISVVAYTSAGQSAEVGVIGREGLAGHDVFLGSNSTPYEYIVQIPNGGWRLNIQAAKLEFDVGASFHDAVLDFIRRMMLQIGQTALCNRLHTAEERLARWLLMCNDRTDGTSLDLTQEFLSKMLGSGPRYRHPGGR